MSKNQIIVQCPTCKEELNIQVPEEALIPIVRSKMKPVATLPVYRFTSDELAEFIAQKAKSYEENTRVEVTVKYCERKNSLPHRSFATLCIALSDDVLKTKGNADWFERIGNTGSNTRVIDDIYTGFIRMYQYDKKKLNEMLDDYKKLETVENQLGMTEAFIEDIKSYAVPRKIEDINHDSWVIFSARAEKVIEDMLSDPATDKVDGQIEIHDVYPINKDTVEFVVFIHPKAMKSNENPYVRQIMMGGKKSKK